MAPGGTEGARSASGRIQGDWPHSQRNPSPGEPAEARRLHSGVTANTTTRTAWHYSDPNGITGAEQIAKRLPGTAALPATAGTAAERRAANRDRASYSAADGGPIQSPRGSSAGARAVHSAACSGDP